MQLRKGLGVGDQPTDFYFSYREMLTMDVRPRDLEKWSEKEIDLFGKYIDHSRETSLPGHNNLLIPSKKS